jgi:hypothetical protein
VDLDDVLVADQVDRPRLLVEAPDHLAVGRQLAVDDLERDLLADDRVLGEVDHAHAADAQARLHPVIADLLPRRDGH